jgi:hypothetical protein
MADQAIIDAITQGFANVAGKTSSPTSAGGSPAEKIDWATMASGVAQATTGTLALGKAGGEAAYALGAIASQLPGIGGGAQKFVTSVEEARQANLKNANQGLATGVLYGELNYKTQALGLTQESYRKLLTDSGGALNSIGMTADIGSKRLLNLGLATQELGKDFIKTSNITQGDLARTTALSQYGSKVNLDNAEAMKSSASAAILLAKEIDANAKITGRSRDAITQELEERLKSPTLQGALNVATEEQRQGIIRSQAQLSGMGSTISDLSATLAINGRLSEDQRKQMQTLGPAAGEFQRASRMAALAQTEDEKRQAAEAMKSAQAKINEYQSSQQFTNAMKNATPEVAGYYQKAYQENQLRGRQQSAQQETGLNAPAALDQMKLTAQRDQLGVNANGQKLAERAVGEVASTTQLNASINSAGAGKALSDLNVQLGQSPVAIKKLGDASMFTFGPGGTIDQAATRHKASMEAIYNGLTSGAPAATAPGTGTTAPGTGATGKDKYGRPTKLAEGTKDVFGDWFGGPSDVFANIREQGTKEAVVPMGKIGEFMSDMMGKLPKPADKSQDAPVSMPSIPSPAPVQQSSDAKTMNDLHKQLVELNTSIKDVAMRMADVSNHTASTAKYSKAASGNRNA